MLPTLLQYEDELLALVKGKGEPLLAAALAMLAQAAMRSTLLQVVLKEHPGARCIPAPACTALLNCPRSLAAAIALAHARLPWVHSC